MTRAYVEAPATHFRLKPETWAIIAEEYKNGATAKDIGAKWKVAPSSVYRYACRDGFTKKSMGDARARAHARMVEEEEAAHRSMTPGRVAGVEGAVRRRPSTTRCRAIRRLWPRRRSWRRGRAMKGRLWAEAKALAGLAEAYARLGEREARAANGGMTIETLPLPLVYEIMCDEEDKARHHFGIWGDGPETEHYELRQAYQDKVQSATPRMPGWSTTIAPWKS